MSHRNMMKIGTTHKKKTKSFKGFFMARRPSKIKRQGTFIDINSSSGLPEIEGPYSKVPEPHKRFCVYKTFSRSSIAKSPYPKLSRV